jgi:hypothetical protein
MLSLRLSNCMGMHLSRPYLMRLLGVLLCG